MACGYDMRGSDSQRCPECGTPRTVPVAIRDSQQFHLAKAMLERQGLLIRSIDPGGALGIVAIAEGFAVQPGWLFVSVPDLVRVEECLDELGIMSSLSSKPIVDRSEPICPQCEESLDPMGPEICPQCATAFQWVEIDQPDVDGTGLVCPNCQYDLAGCSSKNCPECGAQSPENLEAMVAVATGERVAGPPSLSTSPPPEASAGKLTQGFVIECIIVSTLGCIVVLILAINTMPLAACIVALLTAVLVCARIIARS
jgi:hypothetical protein